MAFSLALVWPWLRMLAPALRLSMMMAAPQILPSSPASLLMATLYSPPMRLSDLPKVMALSSSVMLNTAWVPVSPPFANGTWNHLNPWAEDVVVRWKGKSDNAFIAFKQNP